MIFKNRKILNQNKLGEGYPVVILLYLKIPILWYSFSLFTITYIDCSFQRKFKKRYRNTNPIFIGLNVCNDGQVHELKKPNKTDGTFYKSKHEKIRL